MVHEAAEHLDRRPLRADDRVADDARDDLVVADPPEVDPLVPLDQRLGELVELLVLAALDVHVARARARLLAERVERLAERGRDAADLAPAGRVEAAAVAEHLADLLVLPRRHLLEHVELRRRVLQAQGAAAQQSQRRRDLPPLQVPPAPRSPPRRRSRRA